MEKELKVSEHSKSFNWLGYWAFVIAGLFFFLQINQIRIIYPSLLHISNKTKI